MPEVLCPECDEKIRVSGRVFLGRRLACHGCGVELEVINLNPAELDWVFTQPEADDTDPDWDWGEV